MTEGFKDPMVTTLEHVTIVIKDTGTKIITGPMDKNFWIMPDAIMVVIDNEHVDITDLVEAYIKQERL